MSIITIIKRYELQRGEIASEAKSRLTQAIQNIANAQTTLKILKAFIEQNEFESVDAEIAFFKNQKQIPQEDLILEVHIKRFLLKLPINDKPSQMAFIEKELKKIRIFRKENAEFCEYVKLGRSDVDLYYYKRPSDAIAFEHSDAFFKDPIFYTARDLMLSRYKAFIQYSLFLNDQKKSIASDQGPLNLKSDSSTNLHWTLNRTDLTELIYALYHSKAINNGKVDISLITQKFESWFKIDLGDVYKTYSDIKNRKRSHTKFLDALSSTLESEISQSNL